MKQKKTISILAFIITGMATVASVSGIFSREGPGPYEYESIRGDTVMIYGKGIYEHMSAEVAPQGIAQDFITLFVAIPLLLFSIFRARSGSLKGWFLLAGTLGYFAVTYLFYLVMGMYNMLFLAYVVLLSTSFFAFILTLFSFDVDNLPAAFRPSTPVKLGGGFLIANALAIAFLWLSIVVPPLLDGSIFPAQLEHYTTLIVQGLDLALLLPLAFVGGIQFIRKKPFGYLISPIYLGFLSILMTALTAKVVVMALLGHNVVPVIIIIPTLNVLAIFCTVLILNNIKEAEEIEGNTEE